MSHSVLSRCPLLSAMTLAAALTLNLLLVGLAQPPPNTASVPGPKSGKPSLQNAGSSSSADAALPKPVKLFLWSGRAPVGDGQFESADATITVHYPVVTMGEKTHAGSKANLLGRDPAPGLVELFSNEKQVTGQTPPMFLAHAKDDTAVVPDNSRMLHKALRAHDVATEYLELPSGGHGLNGYKGPMWDAWQAKSLKWLAAQKMIPRRDPIPPADP